MVFEQEKEANVYWRKTNVTATFKKGEKINSSSYRMVSRVSVS